MPLQRRIPKRGFTNIFRKEYAVVNLSDLDAASAGGTITLEIMHQNGLIKSMKSEVKVLGTGELKKGVTIRAHKFSKTAVQKIEAAGGKAEVI